MQTKGSKERAKNTIAAIVVTYNRKALLLQCLASLRKQTYQAFDILVIDNASTDGTYAAIAGQIEANGLRYVNTGVNIGGAGGFHVGIAEAAAQGYEFFWLMDDDCIPEPGALEALVVAGDKIGHYGFLSSVALWKDGTPCQMNVQKTGLWKKIKTDEMFEASQRECVVSFATFVSFFLPRRVLQSVGLPISEFFIWADDMEYTRRISRRFPSYVVPSSVVIHACETNSAGHIEADTPERFFRYRCMYRNEIYIYRREGIKGFVYEVSRIGWHMAKVLFRGKDRRLQRMCVVLGGVKEGFSFRPSPVSLQAALEDVRYRKGSGKIDENGYI